MEVIKQMKIVEYKDSTQEQKDQWSKLVSAIKENDEDLVESLLKDIDYFFIDQSGSNIFHKVPLNCYEESVRISDCIITSRSIFRKVFIRYFNFLNEKELLKNLDGLSPLVTSINDYTVFFPLAFSMIRTSSDADSHSKDLVKTIMSEDFDVMYAFKNVLVERNIWPHNLLSPEMAKRLREHPEERGFFLEYGMLEKDSGLLQELAEKYDNVVFESSLNMEKFKNRPGIENTISAYYALVGNDVETFKKHSSDIKYNLVHLMVYKGADFDNIKDPELIEYVKDELNTSDKLGTPLNTAAKLGKKKAFEQLLKLGADPNIRDYEQNSVYHTVLIQNNEEMLMMLPKPNERLFMYANDQLRTPFFYARNRKQFDKLKELFGESGYNEKDVYDRNFGETFFLKIYPRDDVKDIDMDKNIDRYRSNLSDDKFAAEEILKYSKYEPFAKYEDQDTEGARAQKLMKELLIGDDPQAINRLVKTVKHVFVSTTYGKSFLNVIAEQCYMFEKSKSGFWGGETFTLMAKAHRNAFIEYYKFIVEQVAIRTRESPLGSASKTCIKSFAAFSHAMIRKGVKFEINFEKDLSPILANSDKLDANLFYILRDSMIENGMWRNGFIAPPIDQKVLITRYLLFLVRYDLYGESLIDYLIANGKKTRAKFALYYGGKQDESLLNDSFYKLYEAIMNNDGAEFDKWKDHGHIFHLSVVHYMAMSRVNWDNIKDQKIADYIRKHINDKDIFGRTPLHACIEQRVHPENIKKLREYGASATVADDDGNNAYHLSAINDFGYLYLPEGSTGLNKFGRTPLHYAKSEDAFIELSKLGSDQKKFDIYGKNFLQTLAISYNFDVFDSIKKVYGSDYGGLLNKKWNDKHTLKELADLGGEDDFKAKNTLHWADEYTFNYRYTNEYNKKFNKSRLSLKKDMSETKKNESEKPETEGEGEEGEENEDAPLADVSKQLDKAAEDAQKAADAAENVKNDISVKLPEESEVKGALETLADSADNLAAKLKTVSTNPSPNDLKDIDESVKNVMEAGKDAEEALKAAESKLEGEETKDETEAEKEEKEKKKTALKKAAEDTKKTLEKIEHDKEEIKTKAHEKEEPKTEEKELSATFNKIAETAKYGLRKEDVGFWATH